MDYYKQCFLTRQYLLQGMKEALRVVENLRVLFDPELSFWPYIVSKTKPFCVHLFHNDPSSTPASTHLLWHPLCGLRLLSTRSFNCSPIWHFTLKPNLNVAAYCYQVIFMCCLCSILPIYNYIDSRNRLLKTICIWQILLHFSLNYILLFFSFYE